jgi:hypothetical protein
MQLNPQPLPVNDTQPERGGFETWWQSIGFPARSYCVYVLRDAEHQVLYAGKTNDDCLRSRTSNHYTNKPWIEEVARIDIPLSGVSEEAALHEEQWWNHHRKPGPKYGLW